MTNNNDTIESNEEHRQYLIEEIKGLINYIIGNSSIPNISGCTVSKARNIRLLSRHDEYLKKKREVELLMKDIRDYEEKKA